MHAKERLGNPRARLFVALDLPQQVKTALSTWQKELVEAGHGDLRAAATETLHVTLAFIGHRPEKDVPRIAEVVESLEPRPVRFSIDREPTPVPARRPRLYAGGLAANDDVHALRSELVSGLEARAGFSDEKRAFWPHVTLCRVKSRVRGHAPLVDPPLLHAIPDRLWSAPSVTLYRSDLQPAGAVHTALASLSLPSE